MAGMKHISLRTRVIGTVMIFLVAGAIFSNYFFVQHFKKRSFDEILEQSKLLTTFAELTVKNVSNIDINANVGSDSAFAEQGQAILFDAVHMAWNSAIEAAEQSEGVNFIVASQHPMDPKHNPANDPVEGAFRSELLNRLDRSGGTEIVWAVNKETNKLHVMRPFVTPAKCLSCHEGGDDNFGKRHISGAYEITASLASVDKSVADFSRVSGLVNGSIAILLFLAMLVGINRSLIVPLKRLGISADNLSKGQLNQNISGYGNDEIGSLAESFKQMSIQFKNMLDKISSSSKTLEHGSVSLLGISSNLATESEEMNSQIQTVASASEEISANVTNVAAAAEESSNTVQNISAMSEEMSVSLREIANYAKTTSEGMTRAVSAVEGVTAGATTVATAVEELSASISEVAHNTSNASQMANSANQSSELAGAQLEKFDAVVREVAKIIDTIKEIADQTNMLALNATIEAASAGDAGRGFAVVAAEVKALARQSAEAADKISDEINEMLNKKTDVVKSIEEVRRKIQELAQINLQIASSMQEQSSTVNDTSRTVSSMSAASNTVNSITHEALKEVQQIAASADEASRTSVEVARNVEETSVTVREIARMVEEAAKGVNQVSQNIQGIHVASTETAKFAAQTQENAGALNRLAIELNVHVQKFDLS